MESGAFLSVGTVVSPVVSASFGSSILRARLTYENGTEARVELKYGGLEKLPLPSGEEAKLTIQLLRGADIGFGPGRLPRERLNVLGGELEFVLDRDGR